MARLFLGLWPDDAARAAIARWRDAWAWPEGARLVAPDQWHVTLHFLGEVPDDRVAAIAEALDLRDAPAGPDGPVTPACDRPDLWHGGVVVLRDAAPADGLRALHAALAGRLRDAALRVEERPWQPHVTLARHAAGCHVPDASAASALPAVRWTATSYALVASEGGRYRTVRTYALGARAGLTASRAAASSAGGLPPTR